MAEQRVKTTQRTWKTECNQADAQDVSDPALQGVAALDDRGRYPDAYVFSNGRRFADGKRDVS